MTTDDGEKSPKKEFEENEFYSKTLIVGDSIIKYMESDAVCYIEPKYCYKKTTGEGGYIE